MSSTEQGGWSPAGPPEQQHDVGQGYGTPVAPEGTYSSAPGQAYPAAPGYPQAPAYDHPQAPAYGYAPAPAYGYAPAFGYLPPLAGFGTRVLALLIDSAIPFVILLLSIIPMFVLTTPATDQFGTPTTEPTPAGVVLFLLLYLAAMVFSLWNRVFRMGRTGQSIGKQAMHIRLVSEATMTPPGAGPTFVRELINGFASQIVYISYLWPLWDAKKRTLGGVAMKTLVVVA
ncbi:MAG: hypothetical protein JWP95_561 [Actinotalea sp.]|nr:hypothetical protein [Actinotalea sp.]